jgi:glycerol uptake facilitator protein
LVAPSGPTLAGRCLAEAIGTFILVFFGCGAVHSAVLTGAQSGVWQVAVVWGVAIMVAIYVTGAISGAHINPAITLSFLVWRKFPPALALPYVFSQMGGAFGGAAVLFVLFGGFLAEKEKSLGVTRGEPGSEITAMCYGEYYPNPGRLEKLLILESLQPASDHQAALAAHTGLVTPAAAFLAEFLGTLLLALVVFAVTDERNRGKPAANLAPVFIGLTVAILISVLAPLTQAGFNPARDFGPRLFAALAGWRNIALPGYIGVGFVTVYILAPSLGAACGGAIYDKLLRPQLP